MKSLIHRLVVLPVLVAVGLAFPLRAAPRELGQFSFKTYGSDQGLRNLATTSLLQDAAGFIWVGTEDGLYRYDGQTFQRFGTKEGLPSASIRALRIGPEGALWVSTQNKGTGLFKDGQWRALRDYGGVPVGVILSDLACDGLGRSWLASEAGLFMAPPKGTFAPVKELPAAAVVHLWADPQGGEVYAVMKSGKLERLLANGQWEGRALPPGFPRKGDITSMLRDSQGRIWMRGTDWIQRVDGLQGEAHDFSRHLPGAGSQGNNLVQDPLGRVWTPSDAGLVCFDEEGSFIIDESRGFPGHWAGALLVDHQGSLWVASEGVSRLQGRFLWTSFTRKQGIPSDIIWTLLRGRDRTLWVGTQKGLASSGPAGFMARPETAGHGISCLAEDTEGGIWCGPNGGGKTTFVFHKGRGMGRFEQVPVASVQGADGVLAMAWDPSGSLWLGTGTHALQRLWKVGGAWRAEQVKLPEGPPDEPISQILAARGAVFVAGGAGVAILENGAWSRIGVAQGLRDPAIQCLVDAGEGELLATYANIHGIARLRKENGAWKVAGHLDQPEALVEDNILSAGMDVNRVLWLGTSQGVKRWDGKRLEQFLRSDGLPGEDADGNAMLVEPDGVWVGFSNGLGHFDGRSYRGQPAPPEIEFLGIQDGARRFLNPSQGLLTIPYRDRTMSFRFAALSYLNESQVHLQVRLLGFEDDWRDTTVREARYTGLPPGLYQFQVRASLGQGPFGQPENAEFRVLAPWWRTWWFFLFCAGAATGLVVAAVRWRTSMLIKQTQQLEALVQERTRDLKEANSALSHMNRALEEASMVDALTGLKNRRYLALHMPEETARVLRAYRTAQALHQLPAGEDLILLLVDLDHFKSINDTHGHGAGDLVLKQAADTIRKACRVVDTVARWGGEEFLVIARRADRDNADTIARNIRDRIAAEAFDLGNGQTTGRTCSVGFAVYPLIPGDPNAFSWEEVLEVADQCLYAAKKSGRNAWVGVFSNSMIPDPELGQGALGELPAMVAEGRLELRTSFPEAQGLTWKDHVWE
ncbi:MAG TPA: diguanylate cyclase [Holophagaceae bacterium]|nr:diguanylate cyclase [Holophagaceae bacterium]